MKAAAIFTAVLAAGCWRGAGAPDCDGVAGVTVVRMAEHAGAGRELTVRVGFENGIPIGEADLVRCLSASLADGTEAHVAPRPITRGYTLLLVDPGPARRDSDPTRGLVEAIVQRRPPEDKIALYRWGAEATQVAPFLSDRRILLERAAVGMSGTDGMASAADALAVASRAVAAVGGTSADALRTIILVAPRAAALAGLADAVKTAAPSLVMWIGFSDQGGQVASALPPGLRFQIPASTVPAALVATLSDRLDAYGRHGHYALGVCGVADERALEIRFLQAPTTTVTMPATLAENRGGACQAEALAAGRRRFARRLDLLFTDAEREAAAQAYLDKANRPTFSLSVRVGAEAAPTTATAHFRGDGSYGCQRRSYTVNLDGKEPRYLFPGFAASKFHLIAMCLDRLYLRNFTALHLMAEEGLLPVPFDMVELTIDGVSQGPYLVVENVSDSLRAHTSGVTAVVRRDKSPTGMGTAPEVHWATGGDVAAAVASYDRILASGVGVSGQRFENAARERFDLEGYLSWIALMNMLGSGDYADEVFFYAIETTNSDGARADYHLLMGWDQDDLFATCHSAGRSAIYDRFGLVTCTETDLDKRLFIDPLLYSRYADLLEKLLVRYSTERFEALVHATGDKLLTFFHDPEALAGLVELAQINPDAPGSEAVARSLLESEMQLLTTQYDQNRNELLARLDRYQATR